MAKFGTLAWHHEFQKLWESEADHQKHLKGFNSTMLMVIKDKPELKPTLYQIEDGIMLPAREGSEAADKPDYVLAASYDVWQKMLTPDSGLDFNKAMMSRKLTFKGSMARIMKYMKGIMYMTEVWNRVPTEW